MPFSDDQQPYALEQAEEDISILRGQVNFLTEILSQTYQLTGGPAAGAPAAGYQQYMDGPGFPQAISAADGNKYDLVTRRVINLGQTVSSGSLVSVMSSPVAAARYRVQVYMQYSGPNTGGSPSVALAGPTFSQSNNGVLFAAGTGVPVFASQPLTLNGGAVAGPTYATTASHFWLEGLITFSASGTLTFQALTTGAGTSLAIAWAVMTLAPVVAV